MTLLAEKAVLPTTTQIVCEHPECKRPIARWAGTSIVIEHPGRGEQVIVTRGEVHIRCPRSRVVNRTTVLCGYINILEAG